MTREEVKIIGNETNVALDELHQKGSTPERIVKYQLLQSKLWKAQDELGKMNN